MARPSDPNAKIKLLAAAEAIFVAHGLDDAKVEAISRRAGLAKGTFYLHFESKEDAFRQLVESMVARMVTYLDAVPEECLADSRDTRAFLDQWVSQDAQIFEFIWQNRGVMGLLLDGGKSSSHRHLVDEFAEQARVKMRGVLDSGVAAGIYRPDLDIELASSFIAGAYDRLARQIVREPRRPPIETMLRQIQFFVLRGIASTAMLGELDAVSRTPASRSQRKRAQS